ncbi:glycosyltransferase [Chryseobacterium oncorhynchi]|uniref:Glycosyltransferase n=1 Tax=Chryseobacterium oncorhynchi TaxID=741074 RepID=A0A316WGG6_9FLAO|nr:glycosyltransferase [Chryseobacterium oncorhynchi]PWN60615.1 glycosyltransferase [Chryseobacterium oncorhynchi]
MKILHVINGLGGGGAEKLIVDIIPLLAQKGNDVDVLLLNGEKTPFYQELEKQKIGKIFSLGNSFYNPVYIFRIISYFQQYDIVHVHLFPSMYFVVIAKILSFKKIKLIFTEHNTVNRRLDKKIFKPLDKFIYSFYKKIICITPEVKEQLILKLNLNMEKLVVIENGVNLEKVLSANKAERKDLGYKDNDRLLIMVAAFREQKDQDTLIKTLKELPDNYKLLLVGDGARRPKLEDLVSDLNLKDRVNFLGFRSDVYSLYKMCDVAILSSHWEGFGLVSVEAMASGTPMVASNVSGLNSVVKDGGLLFETGNTEELKNIILELINNQEFHSKVSKKGIEKSKHYSIDKTIEKMQVLYNQVNNK